MGTQRNYKRVSDSINIGAADIFFIPAGSSTEIYLGLTKDGALFKYEVEYFDITADQFGKMVLDKVLIGEKCSCEVKVLDTSKDHIYDIVPTAKKLSDGSIAFGQRPGLRASRHTGKLRIHPISLGLDNSDYDIIIYAAFNEAGLELAHKVDEEWVIPCKFIGLAALERENGDYLFRIGEDSETVNTNIANRPFTQFKIAPSNIQNPVIGGQQQFTATVVFTDGSGNTGTSNKAEAIGSALWIGKMIEWESDNEEVISIERDTGLATLKEHGTAKISAKFSDQAAEANITI